MTLRPGTLRFLIGLALGAVVVLVGPRVAGTNLVAALRGTVEIVEGEVTRTPRAPDRLLLTVVTPRGAIRATFKETVVEVHLLVAEGHAAVEDPMIQSVRKKTRAAGPPPGAVGPTP